MVDLVLELGRAREEDAESTVGLVRGEKADLARRVAVGVQEEIAQAARAADGQREARVLLFVDQDLALLAPAAPPEAVRTLRVVVGDVEQRPAVRRPGDRADLVDRFRPVDAAAAGP